MKRMRFARLIVAMCLFLTGSIAFAEETGIPVLTLSGAKTKSDRLRLDATFGHGFQYGAKIFSEPSHSLLLAAMSPAYASTQAGRQLSEQASAEQAGIAFGPFDSQTTVGIDVRGRPAGDNRIAVVAITDDGDSLMVDAKVGSDRFGFSGMTRSAEAGVKPQTVWCCQAGGCSPPPNCCDGTYITCCGPPACSFYCQWVRCPNE